MNIYKHTAISFAIGAFLLLVFKKAQMSIACLLTGVLIDIDHVFDYYMNHELRSRLAHLLHPRKFFTALSADYAKYKPNYVLYKFLHSAELLIAVPFLYFFGLWNAIATGIVIGFVAHLLSDTLPMGNIGVMSLIYRINKGFPTGANVLKQRLSKTGRDVAKCQSCGARGETTTHKGHNSSYVGFTKKNLNRVMILCPDCYERIRGKRE